jgi:hypothetical protein
METVRPSSRSSDRPVLITEAPINVDDEYNRRRKRYLIMMIIRALCIIGAATTFTYSGWLAAAFVAAALVLPWMAVLIANDRPPKQEVRFRRFLPGTGQQELPSGSAAGSQQSEAGRSGSQQSGAYRSEANRSDQGKFRPGEQPRPAGPGKPPEPRIIDL